MQGTDHNDPRRRGNYDPDVRVTGSGAPLILVPGMDGTGRLFYSQVPRLAKRYRVATYALRDDAAIMSTLVDDLAGQIRAITPGGEPAVVVGESFGGALAMTLAVTRPECVRALVVINSFARFLPQFRLHLAMLGVRGLPWGAMGLVRRLTAFRMHSRFTHRREIKRFLQETARTTRAGYLARLRLLMEYDMRERLAEIRVPTLFLAADRDHLIPSVAQAGYMAARVPHATMEILDGHGHICLIAPNLDLAQIIGAWDAIGPRPNGNGPAHKSAFAS